MRRTWRAVIPISQAMLAAKRFYTVLMKTNAGLLIMSTPNEVLCPRCYRGRLMHGRGAVTNACPRVYPLLFLLSYIALRFTHVLL